MVLVYQLGVSFVGQDVECQIVGVGWDYVQGFVGVVFGLCFEIFGL